VSNVQGSLVAVAVEALRHFAGDELNRNNAALLLSMWRHRRTLDEVSRHAVLEHFPPIDGWPVGHVGQ
jgi:hypothetical protein